MISKLWQKNKRGEEQIRLFSRGEYRSRGDYNRRRDCQKGEWIRRGRSQIIQLGQRLCNMQKRILIKNGSRIGCSNTINKYSYPCSVNRHQSNNNKNNNNNKNIKNINNNKNNTNNPSSSSNNKYNQVSTAYSSTRIYKMSKLVMQCYSTINKTIIIIMRGGLY